MQFVWIGPLQDWVGKYEVTNGECRRFDPRHGSPGIHARDDASRMVRGVSWSHVSETDLRCAAGYLNLPSDRVNVIGFRLVVLR